MQSRSKRWADAAPKPRQARFISADSARSKVQLGADGQLPELVLLEGASKEKSSDQEQKTNPMLLVAVLAVSFLATIMMFVLEGSSSTGETRTKAVAREEIKTYYLKDKPPKHYQELLAEALQAHSRGDYRTERRRYREVLVLLRNEGKNEDTGVTGVVDSKQNVPPNDEHLESLLAALLAE